MVASRLPGFAWGILGIDDSDFTVIARSMMRGDALYRDVVDIKPPLAFVLYLPNAWFGDAVWPVQVEGALCVLATALFLGMAARRTWGSERAAVCAAVLAVLAGFCVAPTVSTELLMNLPTAAALAAFARWHDEESDQFGFLSGALLGVAALIRHQAVFTLAALGLALAASGALRRCPWKRRCLVLSGGFAAPWLLTMAVFQLRGTFPEFFEWVVLRNLNYVAQNAGSTALRFAQAVLVCVLAGAPLPWLMAAGGAARTLRAVRSDRRDSGAAGMQLTWAVLLAVTWVPVALGGRFYEHYFLQFVPPLALAGAGPLDALLSRQQTLRLRARAGWLALAILPALGSVGYCAARGFLHMYPLQNEKVLALGGWIRANSEPDARLFVWGHYSPIYLAAGRLPGTRYLTTSWHLGNFDPEHLNAGVDLRKHRSDRDVRYTLEDLARRKPEWVVDTAPADIHSWRRLPLSLVPDLQAAISEGWVEVATVAGARVLRRRSMLVSVPPAKE